MGLQKFGGFAAETFSQFVFGVKLFQGSLFGFTLAFRPLVEDWQ